jgi:hypothetical protein
MPDLRTGEQVTDDAREKARADDEENCCAAGREHDRPGATCGRGAQCHCARPIGHPIPVTVPHGREAGR